MTIISGFFSEDAALLLGDILTSVVTTDPTYLYIPTKGFYASQGTSQAIYKPYSFCQKVNILSPQLAIAWSGSKDEATLYFSEIIGSNNHINPDINIIKSITDEISPDLQIIGMLMENGRYHWFSKNCKPVELSTMDASEVFIGGTGAQKFKQFSEYLDLKTAEGNPSTRNLLLARALGMIGVLLSEEIRTGSTIEDSFGAGYEIVFIDENNCFKKLSDITFLFWNVNKEKELGENSLSPILIKKYFYDNEHLLIHSLLPKENFTFEYNTTQVPPVFSHSPYILENKLSIQDMNSSNIISVYFTKVNGKVYATSRIQINCTNETSPLIFTDLHADEINFDINCAVVNNHITNFYNDFQIQ